jgi:ATP-dependent 26S proteasome regulatory subunit
VVQFPFPDTAQRQEIWQRAFPQRTPVTSLNYPRLARVNMAGGNIRNIAINAAFMAAAEGEPVGMGHLLRATRMEYAKLDRSLTDAEVAGWL